MISWIQHQQDECVMLFFMGLNDSFAQLRAQILMMDPFPTFSKVYSLAIQEERQCGIHQIFAQTSDSCLDSSSITVAVISRSYCKKTSHVKDKCYMLNGFPLGFKFKNGSRVPQSKSSINPVHVHHVTE